jgi:DNA-binding response OmpR family regulator/DNA-binding CsgD family transcriptional regulator
MAMTEPAISETILVVDDSPESLGFLVEALERDGRTVLVARSGGAAVKAAALSRPDAILLDAVMPEMDGFETCRRLKLLPGLAHVPVIFMTGLTETEHIVHALESGGVDYLTKPIDIDELRARIRVHLANAQRANSARIALDATGRHLVAFSPAGEILWATPQAQRLFGTQLSSLGNHIRAWADREGGIDAVSKASSEVGAPDGGRITIAALGRIGSDEYLFQLSPAREDDSLARLRQHFGLTGREAEVLVWIAHGKSNKDIGDILGLSPRTVNKHLEQIYAKLGVENRSSAAVSALRLII